MSISTYSELKQAVANWTHRADLTAIIPDFIKIAEARINRQFLPRSQEFEVELTTVQGSRYVPVPDGLINPVGLWLKAWLPRNKLTKILPSQLPVKTNVTGYPQYWCIDNEDIAFDVLAQSAWTFDFRYTKTFALSDENPTNYILTNNPDLYLWGAMYEASVYTKDLEAAGMYAARFEEALDDAQSNENDTRAISPLLTEIGQIAYAGRFNINRGY